jgi:hypothetical protein
MQERKYLALVYLDFFREATPANRINWSSKLNNDMRHGALIEGPSIGAPPIWHGGGIGPLHLSSRKLASSFPGIPLNAGQPEAVSVI